MAAETIPEELDPPAGVLVLGNPENGNEHQGIAQAGQGQSQAQAGAEPGGPIADRSITVIKTAGAGPIDNLLFFG